MFGIFENKKPDPCGELLEGYLKCVESHTRGLSEGDECKIGTTSDPPSTPSAMSSAISSI